LASKLIGSQTITRVATTVVTAECIEAQLGAQCSAKCTFIGIWREKTTDLLTHVWQWNVRSSGQCIQWLVTAHFRYMLWASGTTFGQCYRRLGTHWRLSCFGDATAVHVTDEHQICDITPQFHCEPSLLWHRKWIGFVLWHTAHSHSKPNLKVIQLTTTYLLTYLFTERLLHDLQKFTSTTILRSECTSPT